MCTIVLRVQGPYLNLDDCLTWIPADLLQTSWRVGEHHAGRLCAASGFTLLLSEGEDSKLVVLEAMRFVQTISSKVRALTAAGQLDAELDVGVYLNNEQDVMTSITFAAEDLAVLHGSGLELKMSAYLSSADED